MTHWHWQTNDGTFQEFEATAQAEIEEHVASFPEGFADLGAVRANLWRPAH